MFFKKKKDKDKIKIFCAVDKPSSYSVIFLSAYREIDIEIDWVDSSDGSEFSALVSSYDNLPSLTDNKFSICRAFPVLTYLNIIGNKRKIEPRKARILAKQNYYKSLIEKILWEHTNKKDKEDLLFLLDQRLEKYKFIADSEFTFADIYMFGFCMISRNEMNKFKNINLWIKQMFDLVKIENESPNKISQFSKYLHNRKIA